MTLLPLTSSSGDLTLVKESWLHSDFQVQTQDGGVVAALQYGMMGNADGQTSEGSWRLERPKGFLHRTIAVTAAGADQPVATIDLKTWTRGGQLEVGGSTYEVSAKGLLKESWSLVQGGQEVLAVRQTGSLGGRKAVITVTTHAQASLLVLLVVHAMISHQRESAGGGAAAGAAAV